MLWKIDLKAFKFGPNSDTNPKSVKFNINQISLANLEKLLQTASAIAYKFWQNESVE